MDLELTGKIALVGGASRGLGRAAAQALAAEGATVIIISRNRDSLEETAEAIRKATGSGVTALPGDLSRPDRAGELARTACGSHGRVDILFNNAGGPPTGQFMDFSDEDWLNTFRTNFLSAVAMTREVLPGMKERQWGRIINLTSIAVKQPLDGLILSNGVRSAVHGWAKTLSNEVAAHGITVNCIMPGYNYTDRVKSLVAETAAREGLSEDAVVSRMTQGIPMKRMGRPEDIGALAAFLASDRAAYITGTSIPVDGGSSKGLL